MRKKMKKKPKRQKPGANASDLVLGYDLGGTKVAVAVVTATGKILKQVRVPVRINEGKAAVLAQLIELGRALLLEYPKVRAVGIASAGPLNPKTGELLGPTNFKSEHEPQDVWARVPLAKILSRALKRPCILENDAAAAMLAEHWKGQARGYKNAMIMTLGTGLGTGIICNGALLRAGRGLHPEAGHLIIGRGDATAPCGCGNLGCAEAYLSGKNFGLRAARRLKQAQIAHAEGREFSALDAANLARAGDPAALKLFDEYADLLAITVHNYVVIYCPEIVVLTGSFAAAQDLFLESARKKLEPLLARRRVGIDFLPKLVVSSLNNDAGILGGAYVAVLSLNQPQKA